MESFLAQNASNEWLFCVEGVFGRFKFKFQNSRCLFEMESGEELEELEKKGVYSREKRVEKERRKGGSREKE